jgi:cytochrome c5
MHDPHHHAPSQDDSGSNPVKLAIGIVIGTVALIIGIILLTQLASAWYGTRDRKGEAFMSEQAVAKRLAPVAEVSIDPNAPAPKQAAAQPAQTTAAPAAAIPPPAAAKTADAGAAGKSTYDSACVACHGAGVAGAPKQGDKGAWAPRIAQGKPALYNSALKGKGAMPPKGGNASLSDDAVKAAVDYMLASAK